MLVINSFDQFWPLSTNFDHFWPLSTSFDNSRWVYRSFVITQDTIVYGIMPYRLSTFFRGGTLLLPTSVIGILEEIYFLTHFCYMLQNVIKEWLLYHRSCCLFFTNFAWQKTETHRINNIYVRIYKNHKSQNLHLIMVFVKQSCAIEPVMKALMYVHVGIENLLQWFHESFGTMYKLNYIH